jgi:CBS domain-containing protein
MMRLVSQIMTKDVLTVHMDTPVFDALKILMEHKVSGLPVVDAQKKLVGVITEKDFLQLLLEGQLQDKTEVKHYMSKNVVKFEEETNVVVVCEFFINNAIRRVPIVKDGVVTGVVSRRDILKLILEDKSA